MKTVKYGSRIKGRFYLILFIRLELDKILKSGNKAQKVLECPVCKSNKAEIAGDNVKLSG